MLKIMLYVNGNDIRRGAQISARLTFYRASLQQPFNVPDAPMLCG
jgi:hypothetical protein